MTTLTRLLLALVLFAAALFGCDRLLEVDHAPTQQGPSQPTSGKEPPSDEEGPSFAPGQLEKHFAKHGHEVGAETKAAYLAKARALVRRSGVAKLHRGSDTLYYDEDSNEFAVVSGKGVLRTYFQPSNGKEYWQKQKAKAKPPGNDDDDG